MNVIEWVGRGSGCARTPFLALLRLRSLFIMCVACLEFLKDKMTVKEFRAALGETTRDDPKHLWEINQKIAESAEDTTRLKEKLIEELKKS